MAISLERYKKLKESVDQAQRDHDRAEGALSSLNARLKKEFGCSSRKEAEEKLATMKQEATKAEVDFNEALAGFEEDWKDRLEK